MSVSAPLIQTTFTCDICINQLKDPRVISCGHTFCYNCLQSVTRCPLCRQPFDSAASLPKNYSLVPRSSLAVPIAPISKISDPLCLNCNSVPATLWCDGCSGGTAYCAPCASAVHQVEALSDHLFAPIYPGRSRRRSSASPSLSPSPSSSPRQGCSRHEEPMKLYCTKCSQILCGLCVKDDHADHIVISVLKQAESLKSKLKASLKPLDRVRDLFAQSRDSFEEDIKKDCEHIREVELKLEELRQALFEKERQRKLADEKRVEAEMTRTDLTLQIDRMTTEEVLNPHHEIHNTIQQSMERYPTTWIWEQSKGIEVVGPKAKQTSKSWQMVAAAARNVEGLKELKWHIKVLKFGSIQKEMAGVISTDSKQAVPDAMYFTSTQIRSCASINLGNNCSIEFSTWPAKQVSSYQPIIGSIISYTWRIAEKELDISVDDKLVASFSGVPEMIVPAFSFCCGGGEVEFYEL